MMAFYSDSDPAPRCHTFSLSFPDSFLLLYIQIGVHRNVLNLLL